MRRQIQTGVSVGDGDLRQRHTGIDAGGPRRQDWTQVDH
jgi:hypothetical protein